MSQALQLTHVVALLQRARDRLAGGIPSVLMALCYGPGASVQARLEAARSPAHPWDVVLADALARVDAARGLWSKSPAPALTAVEGLADCALELRLYLEQVRRYAERNLAWEDSAGLSREQALCVVQLALVLARSEEQLVRRKATAHAWPVPQRAVSAPKPEPVREEPGPRRLSSFGEMHRAFADWGDES